jgi:hypothetical protein
MILWHLTRLLNPHGACGVCNTPANDNRLAHRREAGTPPVSCARLVLTSWEDLMKIDLRAAIDETELLLASLRELDGTDVADEAFTRAARQDRGQVPTRLLYLAHCTDRVRVHVMDAYFSYRERDKGR